MRGFRARLGGVTVATVLMALTVAQEVAAEPDSPALPVGPPVEVVLPDYMAAVQAFEASPPAWNQGIVNVGWGGGRGGPERRDGWIADPSNWLLFDAFDRSGDHRGQAWLERRGIFYDVTETNEYNEALHFIDPEPWFGRNGLARDLDGRYVKSRLFPDVYVVNNNAPRWSAVIEYDWLTSPLLGNGISQDNIGSPTGSIGIGTRGRYDDYDSLKFCHHLQTTGRLPGFCKAHDTVRSYINGNPKLRNGCNRKAPGLFDRLPHLQPPCPGVTAPGDLDSALSITDDPILAEYQLFQHLSHLHNLVRYYRGVKLVAERSGRREFDVHGNQSGNPFIGSIPYHVVVADFLDGIWFETRASHYDIFQKHWNGAWGTFGIRLGEAMARGRKPAMFMTIAPKAKGAPMPEVPDTAPAVLFDHAWAEVSAGGAIPLFKHVELERFRPDVLPVGRAHLELRDDHRAIFERRGRDQYAQVAILYSVPTFLYGTYMPLSTFSAPFMNNLAGAARSLEEGHVPHAVVILDHPDLRPDRLTLKELLRYRVLVAPSVRNLSGPHADLLREYIAAGGRLVVLGELGERNERNRKRTPSLLAELLEEPHLAGSITRFGRDYFPPSRLPEAGVRQKKRTEFFDRVRKLVGQPLVTFDEPGRLRKLWVKSWRHADGFISAHFVNYAITYDPKTDPTRAMLTPTASSRLTLKLPPGVPAEEAAWLVPGAPPKPLEVQAIQGGGVVTLPAVQVYGVLVMGPRGLDRTASHLRRGDRYLLRARTLGEPLDGIEDVEAKRGATPAAYDRAARDFLLKVTRARERRFRARILREVSDAAGAVLALDFGSESTLGDWKPVSDAQMYDPRRGYGWLPSQDRSSPTPEESHYRLARKWGGDPDVVRSGPLPHWPFQIGRPRPVTRVAFSGRAHRFRIDLTDGSYRVRLIQANGSWSNTNFRVSGMTFADGRPVFFDVPLDEGDLIDRSFTTNVQGGSLELTFGGPTGWGIAGLAVYPDSGEPGEPDPLVIGGIRHWRASPRYPNPDWYPIEQVRGEPEADLAHPLLESWTALLAAPRGLPLVDLGTTQEGEVGDVVYVAAVLPSPGPTTVRLSLGASSSAVAYVNGVEVAYLPNVKGVMRDEAIVDAALKAGKNMLVIKLQRFWERHWTFYASVRDGDVH